MNAHCTANVRLLCCSVLQLEMQTLRAQYWPNLELGFLSSILHMQPEKLGKSIKKRLSLSEGTEARKTLLVYGDCCPTMTALQEKPGMLRVNCNNCCELLLGRAQFRQLAHAGAFFLIPEWARRWRSVFAGELGLDAETARCLMRDMQTKLLYLDTQLVDVPVADLEDFSAYCGLPWEVMPLTLNELRNAVEEALNRFQTDSTATCR